MPKISRTVIDAEESDYRNVDEQRESLKFELNPNRVKAEIEKLRILSN